MTAFAGWTDYPLNLSDYDSVTTNGKEWKRLFANLAVGGAAPLFSDEVNVRVWDIEGGSTKEDIGDGKSLSCLGSGEPLWKREREHRLMIGGHIVSIPPSCNAKLYTSAADLEATLLSSHKPRIRIL